MGKGMEIGRVCQDLNRIKKAACGDTDCLKEGGVSKLRFKAYADLKVSLSAEYRLSTIIIIKFLPLGFSLK